jgi:NADPH-dependent 2,4-dienoyl-CoA reductase/sulfur reductase-like enzyme
MTEIRYSKNIPILDSCDVLVVGGGSAGSSAAIAAARNGAKVILLERYGFLGGTGTAVLDTFYGFYTPGTVEKKVVGGIPDEVIAGLERRKSLIKRHRPRWKDANRRSSTCDSCATKCPVTNTPNSVD